MEGKCRLHKNQFLSYCLNCKQGFCGNCYSEGLDCKNEKHKASIIDYEMFLHGCCEKHYKKLIGVCIQCNRAWCISCLSEGMNCSQKVHGSSVYEYLEYKKYVGISLEKYDIMQEKPNQEHLNQIIKIMKNIKEDSFQKSQNEFKLEIKLKSELQQIYSELKRNSLHYNQNISLILKNIFKSSLIIRRTQREIRNSQFKANIFNIQQSKIHESLYKFIKDLAIFGNIVENQLKTETLFDRIKNDPGKTISEDTNIDSNRIKDKKNTFHLLEVDLQDIYPLFQTRIGKGEAFNLNEGNSLSNLVSSIKELVKLYPVFFM